MVVVLAEVPDELLLLARTATRIGEMVTPFRLVTLETVKLPPGRQSISVTEPSASRLHAQKVVVACRV
jgi:hypothetical protein